MPSPGIFFNKKIALFIFTMGKNKHLYSINSEKDVYREEPPGTKSGQGIEPSFEKYDTLDASVVSATIIEIAPQKF